MHQITKFGLNLLQKSRLDYLTIKALNNRVCNPLMLKYCWQEKNYYSYYELYQNWENKLTKNNICFKDKSILEVGSGGSIGLGYFFFKENFKLWVSTDFFRDLNKEKRLIAHENKLLKKIQANYDREIFNQAAVRGGKMVFGRFFDFFKLGIETLAKEFIGKFDIVISNVVLEHLEKQNIDRAISNLNKYLKTGGLMIHNIDLRDHINVANPHGFYKYSETDWDKLTRGTIFYTNRLRSADYLYIFKSKGFITKYLERTSFPLAANIKVDPCFGLYGKKDLETTNLFIISEKINDYE